MTKLLILMPVALVAALACAWPTAHAQDTPFPVVLTMTAPERVVAGQEITYRVHYELTDLERMPGTDIVMRIPRGTTFASTLALSGPARKLVDVADGQVRWSVVGSAEEAEGDLEVVVRIDSDFVGSLFASVYVPGTEGPVSNTVETQVLAPASVGCGEPREPGESAILGHTNPPVSGGTARIPELDLTSEIVLGCFEFRHLTLPEGPMLVSIEVRAAGYRPTTWASYLVLADPVGWNFTPRLEPGDEPQFIDPCPSLLATPQHELSAAQGLHASLCAQLPQYSSLPAMGGGPPTGDGRLIWSSVALALVGVALFVAGRAAAVARSAR